MTTALTALLLLCLSQDPPDSWRELDLPFPREGPVDEKGNPQWIVARIVDAVTGRPIAGATMTVSKEDLHPLAGVFWGSRAVLADAEGWARIATAELGKDSPYVFFQAPGYAPVGESGPEVDFPIRLRRGVDVPLQVRDAFDRPVRGARVGLLLGCGHTPDVLTVDTDAEGRALLRSVTPGAGELWPVGAGLYSEYHDTYGWAPGDPPVLLRCPPAPVFHGVVLDHKGNRVANVPVGAPRCHRGPWTRSLRDGTFQLLGAGALAELELAVPGAEHPLRWRPSPAGHRSEIRLTEDRRLAAAVEAAAASAAVRVRVRTSPADGPAATVQVFAVRLADGWCELALTNDEGEAELKVPPGRYELHADGWLAGLGRSHQLLEVGAESLAAELKVTILPLALVQAPDLPKGGRVLLTTRHGEREITQLVRDGKPLPAPEDEAAFRLEAFDRDKVVPCPKGLGLMAPRPFVLPWYRPTRVTARFVAPDGAPAAVSAVLEASVADSPDGDSREGLAHATPTTEVSLTTTRAGPATLFVVPEADTLRATLLPVRLPHTEGLTLDLGQIQLAARRQPQLLLRLPNGPAPAGLAVTLTRPDGTRIREHTLGGGTWDARFALPATGDQIRAAGPEGYADLTCTLAGAGPWTLTWPDTVLTVQAVTEGGAPVEAFAVFRDGLEIDAGQGGALVVRGLPPGTYSLVVAARGYVAQTGPVTIAAGVPAVVRRTLTSARPSSQRNR